LKNLHKTVSVTGEGMNDVEAMNDAHMSFCMGSGLSVAKEASKVILYDDNVESIINSSLWGRNIYGNARKFI
jgi:magnesium-transporting ATPase (P-type)